MKIVWQERESCLQDTTATRQQKEITEKKCHFYYIQFLSFFKADSYGTMNTEMLFVDIMARNLGSRFGQGKTFKVILFSCAHCYYVMFITVLCVWIIMYH